MKSSEKILEEDDFMKFGMAELGKYAKANRKLSKRSLK